MHQHNNAQLLNEIAAISSSIQTYAPFLMEVNSQHCISPGLDIGEIEAKIQQAVNKLNEYWDEVSSGRASQTYIKTMEEAIAEIQTLVKPIDKIISLHDKVRLHQNGIPNEDDSLDGKLQARLLEIAVKGFRNGRTN